MEDNRFLTPLISILIPVYNESRYITGCLDAILAQEYPTDQMEILIIDGMSTDDTRKIITVFAESHPRLDVRLLDNPRQIVATGLNIGLRMARGEIIIRVDGHCVIHPDYVRKCVEHLRNDGVDGVGGPMDSIGDTKMARAIAVGMSSRFGVGNSAFRTISGRSMLTDTVPFPAYPRKVIDLAGAYDEELVRNQDDEYNYRIRNLGGKILLAEDVRSRYYSRSTLMGLWKQYFQYGFWKVRVLQKFPRQMSLRQFVPPIFVLILLVSLPMAFSAVVRPFVLMFLLTYVVANLGASIWTASQRGWSSLLQLPAIYAALHFGYGTGFLIGLIRFRGRWGDKQGRTPSLGN